MARKHTAYTLDKALAILSDIAEGSSVRKACEKHELHINTLLTAVREDRDGLAVHYARAREEQADYHADEIIEIADEPVADAAQANRNRLRVDARKWVACKLRPKVYGDSQRIEHTGNITLGQVLNELDGPTK